MNLERKIINVKDMSNLNLLKLVVWKTKKNKYVLYVVSLTKFRLIKS